MSEINHLSLANKNHDTLKYLILDPDKYCEWIATVAYYKAIQVVEAVLVSRGRRSSSHSKRLDSVKKIGRPELHRHLRSLWSASCIARYLFDHQTGATYNSFHDYMKPEDVVNLLVTRRLKPIELLCLPMLPASLQAMLLTV